VNMVDQKFIKTLNQNLAGTQTIKASGGTIKFVTQSMTVHMVAKMTTSNKTFQNIMKDVERVDKQINEKKSKGVTDIAETVGDVANNAIDTAQSALLFLPYLVGGVIILFIILWLSGVLETGANTASDVARVKAGVVNSTASTVSSRPGFVQ